MSAKQGEDQAGTFVAILSGKALREALRQCSHVEGFLALIGTPTHLKVVGVSSYAMACSPVPWRSTGGTLLTLIRTSPAWRRLIPTGDVALKIDGDGVPHIDTETGPIAFPTGAGFVPNVEAIEQVMTRNTVRAQVRIPRRLFPTKRNMFPTKPDMFPTKSSSHDWPCSHYTLTETGLCIEPQSYEMKGDELVLRPPQHVEGCVLRGEVGTTVCLADNLTLLARRVFGAEHVMLDIHGERESVRFWVPENPCSLCVMTIGIVQEHPGAEENEKAVEGSV